MGMDGSFLTGYDPAAAGSAFGEAYDPSASSIVPTDPGVGMGTNPATVGGAFSLWDLGRSLLSSGFAGAAGYLGQVFGGGGGIAPTTPDYQYGELAGGGYGVVGIGAPVGGRISAIESVVPKALLAAGAGAAIYEAYRFFRSRGHRHKTARRLALQLAGIRLKRRRMRATNIQALRRALRRLRGFRRISGRVRGAFGHRGGYGRPRTYRHRYRRGDVSPYALEDIEDAYDDYEDLEEEGIPVGSFR